MDFGQQLWAAYLERFFPSKARPPIERLGAEAALRLIWPLLGEVASRAAFLDGAEPSPDFDREADAALTALAEQGGFGAWESLSAGAWAVLIDRLQWAVAALTLEMSAGSAFTIVLPRDAPEDVRRIAALLLLLGGSAAHPPEEWRRSRAGKRPAFPPRWPLSRQ